jgi:hypothetical protein
MGLSKFIKDNEGILKNLLKSLLLSALKVQASGGIKGWLIRTLVKEFAEEVIECVRITVDYVEIKHKLKDTINEENRDDATDTINDIIK